MLQIPLPGAPTVGVFYTGKIQGGQDHIFLFRGGFTNYKAHYGLSWFYHTHHTCSHVYWDCAWATHGCPSRYHMEDMH
jgi:hypothetical protein